MFQNIFEMMQQYETADDGTIWFLNFVLSGSYFRKFTRLNLFGIGCELNLAVNTLIQLIIYFIVLVHVNK